MSPLQSESGDIMALWIWISAALLLLALEVAAPGFIMCSLAVGCIAAAAGAAFSLPLIWQVVLCALGMVLGFSVIRPLLQRKKDGMATNAERMIGMPAEVVEAIPAGGKGYVIDNPCTTCHGTGTVSKREKLMVTIPAGVDNGARLTLRGKGDEGTNGGPAGDLVLFISVRPDRYFVREGQDVYLQVPISMAQATLGASIFVPTIDGSDVSVEIPSGIQSGTMLRLKGKGVPVLNGKGCGDMYLRIVVEIPKRLSMKAKGLMKELAAELKETTRPEPMEFRG